MPCCLPFTLLTCRFKKNKVVDKCFPHKSNTNVFTKGPLTSPFTHLLLSCMKYFSTLEENFFFISVAVNFYFSIVFGYGNVC